jgi:hypothetical protein
MHELAIQKTFIWYDPKYTTKPYVKRFNILHMQSFKIQLLLL